MTELPGMPSAKDFRAVVKRLLLQSTFYKARYKHFGISEMYFSSDLESFKFTHAGIAGGQIEAAFGQVHNDGEIGDILGFYGVFRICVGAEGIGMSCVIPEHFHHIFAFDLAVGFLFQRFDPLITNVGAGSGS